jgi:hypothetical protein
MNIIYLTLALTILLILTLGALEITSVIFSQTFYQVAKVSHVL